jgi:hypothetical protein
MGSFLPSKPRAISIISFIDTISVLPRFSGCTGEEPWCHKAVVSPTEIYRAMRHSSDARHSTHVRTGRPQRPRTSLKSDLVMRSTPSTQSSMKVKERVCLPSPHISISSVLVSTLRQKAAGAFSRPPFHVPYGPARHSVAPVGAARSLGRTRAEPGDAPPGTVRHLAVAVCGRTVDVVEARDAHCNAEVLLVVHADLLAGQLLQSVCILGLLWPSTHTECQAGCSSQTAAGTPHCGQAPRQAAAMWGHVGGPDAPAPARHLTL